MASPISLELTPAMASPGDALRGRVRILEDMPRANRLDVKLVAVGNRTLVGEVASHTVTHGALRAGEEHAFELPVPIGLPSTYRGDNVSVDWEVLATVDVPWAFDPTVREPVLLVPKPVESAREREAFIARLKEPAATKASPLVGVILLLIFLPLIVMLLPIIIPIALIVWVKDGLVRTRLSDFTFSVPETALMGDALPVEVSFLLRRPVDVEKVTITLTCKEHWVTGSGKHRHHHAATVYRHDEVPLERHVLAPEHPLTPAKVRFRAVLPIPGKGPPTVKANDAVRWEAEARVWLEGWPDPVLTKKLLVVPARGAGPAEKDAQPLESSGVVFVPRGSQAPLGVDVSVAGAAVWGWLVLTIVGCGVVVLDLALWLNRVDLGRELGLPVHEPHAVGFAGAAALLIGTLGVAYRMLR